MQYIKIPIDKSLENEYYDKVFMLIGSSTNLIVSDAKLLILEFIT